MNEQTVKICKEVFCPECQNRMEIEMEYPVRRHIRVPVRCSVCGSRWIFTFEIIATFKTNINEIVKDGNQWTNLPT